MKLKSLLKVSSAIRLNIVVPRENGKLFDYDIDYSRKTMNEKYEGWQRISSTAWLPDEIMDAKVEMVSTDSATGALRIYVKGVTVA